MRKSISHKIFIIQILFFAIFSLTNKTQLSGQELQEVIIKTVTGEELTGTIKSSTDSTLILVIKDVGELIINKSNIVSIENIQPSEIKYDKRGFPIDEYNSNRYLANPSGYGLRRGQSYYENIYVFFNSFGFGVTDNFTISIGAEIATLLFGGNSPLLYVSPRFSFPFSSETGAFSAGAIFFTLPDEDFDGFGIAQGAITLGGRNNNVNFGFGVGFSTENDFNEGVLMTSFAATTRLSRKLSLVTDNFILSDSDFDDTVVTLSAALRIHFNKSKSALNVGLWRPLEDLDDLVAIPFVSATIPLK